MGRVRTGNPTSLANNSSIPLQIQRALRKTAVNGRQEQEGAQTQSAPDQKLSVAEMQRVTQYVRAQLQGSGALGAQIGLAANKPGGLTVQQAGYLYWESDTNHMRVWNGSTWGTVS
jgi:hypothetical protein